MKKHLDTALGFILLGGIGYLLFIVIRWLAKSISNIDPGVGVALVTAATTIISSVYIASVNARKAKERMAFEAHRGKKAEIYNEFMGVILEIVENNPQKNSTQFANKLTKFFPKFTAKLLIYGGPEVVKIYSKWRETAPEDSEKGLLIIDEIFRAMRTDLGESNKGLDKNELLGLFIIGGKKEIDKHKG